jgi:hypothetical protein
VKLNRLISLIVGAAFLGTPGQPQTRKSSNLKEQSDFGAEDEKWDRPIPVPKPVLQILISVRKALPDELPAEWLLASEIHLYEREERDLIVMGVGGLRLPHAALFWVFRETPRGYELVLSTGGEALTVLDGKWKGFRKIRVYNNTASTTTSTIYRFDGRQYVVRGQKTKPIRTKADYQPLRVSASRNSRRLPGTSCQVVGLYFRHETPPSRHSRAFTNFTCRCDRSSQNRAAIQSARED